MSGRMIGGVCVSYSYKVKRANPHLLLYSVSIFVSLFFHLIPEPYSLINAQNLINYSRNIFAKEKSKRHKLSTFFMYTIQ